MADENNQEMTAVVYTKSSVTRLQSPQPRDPQTGRFIKRTVDQPAPTRISSPTRASLDLRGPATTSPTAVAGDGTTSKEVVTELKGIRAEISKLRQEGQKQHSESINQQARDRESREREDERKKKPSLVQRLPKTLGEAKAKGSEALDELAKLVLDTFKTVRNTFEVSVLGTLEFIGNVLAPIGTALHAAWQVIKRIDFSAILEPLKKAFSLVLDVAVELGKVLYDTLVVGFKALWAVGSKLLDVMEFLAGKIADILQPALDGLAEVLNPVIDQLTSLWETGLQPFMEGLREGIRVVGDFFDWFGQAKPEDIMNYMIGVLKAIPDAFNNALANSWLGKKLGFEHREAAKMPEAPWSARTRERRAESAAATTTPPPSPVKQPATPSTPPAAAPSQIPVGKYDALRAAFEEQGITDVNVQNAMIGQASRESNLNVGAQENLKYTSAERIQTVFGKGLKKQNIDPASLVNNPEALAELRKIAALTDQLSKDKLAYMLQNGMITKFQFESLRNGYKHYVNLSGNKETDLDRYDGSQLGGRAFNVRGSDVIRSTGRGTQAVDVLQNTLNAYVATVIRGQKNRVLNSILNMFEQNPDKTYVEVNPIDTMKRINVDRFNFDNKVLAALGTDKPTQQAGRNFLVGLKQMMERGEITSDDALAAVVERIRLAEEIGRAHV